MEGSYRLSIPNPLLGYVKETLIQSRPDTSGMQGVASVLRMFVTMDPVLAPPETMQQSVRIYIYIYSKKSIDGFVFIV